VLKLADMPSGLGGGGKRNKTMHPDPVFTDKIRSASNRSVEVRILLLQQLSLG